MESSELQFKHVGLSTDGAVIFCHMDNGKTYPMPLGALEQAEDWDAKAKPQTAGIIHDGYAAFVQFDTGVKIDFPSDFVLHICEPSYAYSKKSRTMSGVGGRIRGIREARGLTLDALAVKCGIAKPNLSRLENDKVTPTFETLSTVAAALDTHPALLVSDKKPEHAWTWTRHVFTEWKNGLLWKPTNLHCPSVVGVHTDELVRVFLATRPEHRYASKKLSAIHAPHDPSFSLDAEKWNCEITVAKRARQRADGLKITTSNSANQPRLPLEPTVSHDDRANYLHLRLERLRQCIATFEQQLTSDKDELCQMVDRGKLKQNDPAIRRGCFHLEYVLGNTVRSAMFVGVCSFLEEALKEVSRLLVPHYGQRMKKDQAKKGNWLNKHIRVLTEEGIDFRAIRVELKTLNHCITLRNCVVHDSGKVTAAKDPDAVRTAVRHVDTAEISRDGYLLFGDSVCATAIWAADQIVRHLLD
jgi:transcriptional regulator with XRE-family HTH domain